MQDRASAAPQIRLSAPSNAASAHLAATGWLARQLRWERRLDELRRGQSYSLPAADTHPPRPVERRRVWHGLIAVVIGGLVAGAISLATPTTRPSPPIAPTPVASPIRTAAQLNNCLWRHRGWFCKAAPQSPAP
jgi:hypothetical protein